MGEGIRKPMKEAIKRYEEIYGNEWDDEDEY